MPLVAPRPKDTKFQMRVAADELEAWRVAAEAEDMALADWIRRQLRAAIAASRKSKR